MDKERLLARFLRYIGVETTSADDAEGYPSSPGQLALGKLLVKELRAMGLPGAHQDEHGLVHATFPPNAGPQAPAIVLCSHLDTSPETTAKDVKPQVLRGYVGGDVPLPGDRSRVIRVAENPELGALVGATLITTDGTTLLGADDKAGVAVIMEVAESLLEDPSHPRGPVRLLFTCDEEIGRGASRVDVAALGAAAAYTLDGQGHDEIDVETFSADMATVTVLGVNIHPAIAKDRMVNALRAAGRFLDRLPAELSPERTAGRDGFLHPLRIEGGVDRVVIKVLLRDFVTAQLAQHAEVLRKAAALTEAELPGTRITVETRKQYRNMADGMREDPRAVELAKKAHARLGRTPKLTVVRGGTDGSQFTERGLPTPNLSCGAHNPHSPLEWACLEEMAQAVEVTRELVRAWAEA